MGDQDLCEALQNRFFYLNLIGRKPVKPLLTPQWDFNGVIECGPWSNIFIEGATSTVAFYEAVALQNWFLNQCQPVGGLDFLKTS